MTLIFPKLVDCTIHENGPSGLISRTDGLCVLPINATIEKMILVLWFWYIILAIVTAINLLMRIPALLSKYIRALYFPNRIEARELVYSSNFGDWFVLCQVGKNINHRIFEELLVGIHRKLHRLE
ncbi:innexin inx2-like [Homalodisca vitripennis]|uniref:innexin inx2-like n=1 Tax=Homalodisca vitripennis TaxID=197043 RepID=UPI001EEB54E8|nr:innexin inx2-like [Homalodisca vitripennis]